jgi:DNA-binding Lrp family transcriptional regulator
VAELDPVDAAIVRELAADARIANNVLAARVGIAPSTCHGRVRSLFERGVIRGVHADVDQAKVGRPLQAMISVRLRPESRGSLQAFAQTMAALPEVLNVYFLAGADDFLLQVATAGSEELREFVVHHLSGRRDVAMTETNLIFEHLRGVPVEPDSAGGARKPARPTN